MNSETRIANLFLAVFTALVIALLTKTFIFPNEPTAVVISLLALIVSITSNFKSELFPFQLKLLAGNTWLYQPTEKVNETLLILEIFFVNQGYADGVISAILLRLIDPQGRSKLYSTADELDTTLVREITFNNEPGTKRIGIGNLFGPFPIPAKQSVKKFISFEPIKKESQTLEWVNGSYKFEIYAASTAWKDWKKVFEFDHVINSETLTRCQRQGSFRIAGQWSPKLMKGMRSLGRVATTDVEPREYDEAAELPPGRQSNQSQHQSDL